MTIELHENHINYTVVNALRYIDGDGYTLDIYCRLIESYGNCDISDIKACQTAIDGWGYSEKDWDLAFAVFQLMGIVREGET